MADERKVIYIEINASKAVDGSSAATRALAAIEKSTASVGNSLSRLEGALRNALGGYLGMQGIRVLANAAEAFTRFTNSLKVAGIQGEALAGVQERLFAAANRHGVEIGTVGQLYGRLATSSKELGASQAQMLKFTDGVTAALRVQGGSTAQASGALLQLSQAMGAGIVRAEEFNSILEGALPIAQAAARGMDGMGGSVAKLRGAVIAGKVTSQQFFEALLRGFSETERQAASASLTIDGALTGLNNNWTKFVGGLDQAAGASRTLVSGIDAISRALENLSKIASNAPAALLNILSAAGNPGGFAAGLVVSRSPAESLAAEIDKKRAELNNAREFVAGMDANNGRRALYEREVARFEAELAALERRHNVAAVGGRVTPFSDDPDNIGLYIKPAPTPPIPDKNAGKAAESAEAKYAKLTVKLQETARAQDLMTAAARAGDVAFAEQQVHLDAVQKTLEIFGKRLADNDPLLVELEARLLRISRGKAAEAFNVATTELEKQNVILEAQIRLMDEAPEIQAREIALIKAKTEAEKAGGALKAEDIENRRIAIEQNERLKTQQEDLRKSQELWTEPLKQALRDIQSTAADAFEEMLNSGKISFESLGQIFKKIITRMAAEFLALATIRPVMSVLVNAVSPGFARQMGLGSTGLGGAGGGSLGVPSTGGGGSLFSGGMLGGLGDWLNTPLTGPYAGMSPSSMAGVPMLSPSIMNPSTWGITPMQGLGAAAGIGMGAYQLLSGGGSTASTIGGIGSMIGGAASLIPGVGQIAGPAIAILSSILSSLFGESKPTITDQAYGQLAYGSGGFGTSGGAWGPNANASSLQGPLSQIGGTMQAIFDAFGGVKEAGRVWGVALESFSQQYGDDSSFQNQTSFLVGPNGEKRQWGMGSNASDIGMEAAGVAATLSSILDGAVGEISDNMRKALEGVNKSGKDTLETVGTVVAEVMAYDDALKNLGKTTTEAESALKAIDDSFRAMFDTAAKYSFDTAVLEEAKAKERLRVSTDFAAAIDRQLMDPLTRALTEIGDERTALLRNNSALMAVQGHLDQTLRIEELYAAKRNEIMEQANAASLAAQRQASAALVSAMAGSVSRIQDLIRELSPGGALSNLDPAGQLAGLRASASASLAQAFANPSDASLIDRAVSDQRAFLEFNRSFTGGSTAYVRDQQAALSQLQALQGASTQGAIGGAGDPAVRNLLQRLLTAVQQSNDNSAKRSSDIDKVIGLLARYLANEAA